MEPAVKVSVPEAVVMLIRSNAPDNAMLPEETVIPFVVYFPTYDPTQVFDPKLANTN